ncbi:MAG: hypothetical protein OEO71_09520 [Gammaproteobacteria bacterium]|nr:hypothetical protein [Gammaproteobacteria bacterium]
MSSRILFVVWIVVSPMCVANAWADTASDYNKTFEQAVAAVDFNFAKHWAYTETRVDSEHVWVGRSDPRRPARERWQLISVDDREPTDDEIKKYRNEKAGERLPRNHKTIKPAFGVKISKLITRLTFGPAADGGPVVPISAQVEAKGRAFLVVAFDEHELVHNSDFEYVAEDLEMVPDK